MTPDAPIRPVTIDDATTDVGIRTDTRRTGPYVPGVESPAFDAPAPAGYELLGELGRGGMGVVLRARHVKLNRPTAIKMVLGSARADSKEIIRFLAEAEAVAAVVHAHVVGVYEFGEADGRPFLALELCPGGSLAQQLASGGRKPAVEAATLVRKLAEGVAAAHALGIVHRDLKPGNVLFDDRGEPKVCDFGLAKLGAGADLTQSQAVMGTPAYMSPEQAKGETKFVGPTADVWALGVILYECLAGRRPFAADDSWALLQQVMNAEPTGLRTVSRDVPRDLDLICRKCLAKAAHERYATAAELAADLDRYLNGKPILARSAGVVERGWKWAKRNKPAVAVIAALAAGIGFSSWQTFRAVTAERTAREETTNARTAESATAAQLVQTKLAEVKATQERDMARAAREHAWQAVEAMTGTITGESLTKQVAISAEQKLFLAEVLPFYAKFAGETATDEETRVRVAGVAYRIGMIHNRLGHRNEGVAAFTQARDRFAALAADFPTVSLYRVNLAASHANLRIAFADLGKPAEAANRAAISIYEKLVVELPAEPSLRQNLAMSHNYLGLLLSGLGRQKEAEAAYRTARVIIQKLAADVPAASEYRSSLAAVHNNLGNLFEELGKTTEAEASFRAGMAIQAKLVADFPAVPLYRNGLAKSYGNRGVLLAGLKKWTEAVEAFQAALAIFQTLAADLPAVPEYRNSLAGSHTNLGNLFAVLGKRAEAEAAYRAGLAIHEALVADFPAVPDYRVSVGVGCNNLGSLVRVDGGAAKSLAWYEKAIAALGSVVAAEPRAVTARQHLIESYGSRAGAYHTLRRYADAIAEFDKALAYDDGTARAKILTARAVCVGLLAAAKPREPAPPPRAAR